MTFIAPAALALLALAVPIVVLYMLRTKRARTRISSTMLWRAEVQNVSANAPWQPLRLSWLLILQLLALLLIVLAVARPATRTALPLAEHTVLIVDTSASMQAVEDARPRLEAAKRAAIAAVDQLAGGKRMSVIDAGPRARVVLSGSTDKRALVQAISSLRATDGVTDAAGAFSLGASLDTADTPTVMHFYSDGGVRAEDRADAPGTLVHVPVGSVAGNVAVARVALARRGGGWTAFTRLLNSSTATLDATLELVTDGAVLASQPVRLPATSSREISVALPRTAAASAQARVTNVRAAPGSGQADPERVNALAVDDVAHAVFEREAGMRVLLVTPGNVFMRALIESVPGAQVSESKTAAPATGYTLAIYDRVAPPRTLDVPAIVIASPGGAPGVSVGGAIERPVPTFVQPREPLLEQVDLSRLSIRRAQRVRAPQMRTLVAAGEDPLLAIGIPEGRRLAYLTFDLRESNLPVQVAFPLLFGNLLTWAAEGDAGARTGLVAGDPLPLRVPGRTERIEITTPSGAVVSRSPAAPSFDETETAGIYTARALSADGVLGTQRFAVNVPPLESSLNAQPITGSLEARQNARGTLEGLRAWGPGILAAVLALLMLEWWIAHGRPTRARRWRPHGSEARP